jgi:hypothetical protein
VAIAAAIEPRATPFPGAVSTWMRIIAAVEDAWHGGFPDSVDWLIAEIPR